MILYAFIFSFDMMQIKANIKNICTLSQQAELDLRLLCISSNMIIWYYGIEKSFNIIIRSEVPGNHNAWLLGHKNKHKISVIDNTF